MSALSASSPTGQLVLTIVKEQFGPLAEVSNRSSCTNSAGPLDSCRGFVGVQAVTRVLLSNGANPLRQIAQLSGEDAKTRLALDKVIRVASAHAHIVPSILTPACRWPMCCLC